MVGDSKEGLVKGIEGEAFVAILQWKKKKRSEGMLLLCACREGGVRVINR